MSTLVKCGPQISQLIQKVPRLPPQTLLKLHPAANLTLGSRPKSLRASGRKTLSKCIYLTKFFSRQVVILFYFYFFQTRWVIPFLGWLSCQIPLWRQNGGTKSAEDDGGEVSSRSASWEAAAHSSDRCVGAITSCPSHRPERWRRPLWETLTRPLM